MSEEIRKDDAEIGLHVTITSLITFIQAGTCRGIFNKFNPLHSWVRFVCCSSVTKTAWKAFTSYEAILGSIPCFHMVSGACLEWFQSTEPGITPEHCCLWPKTKHIKKNISIEVLTIELEENAKDFMWLNPLCVFTVAYFLQ